MSAARPVRAVAARHHRAPSRAAAVGIAAATLLLVASGCAATASAGTGEPDVSATYEGAQLTFGSPFEYGDGLFVQVKRPVNFTPSMQAEWDQQAEGVPVRIRLTITNGTRDDYNPHTLSASAVSGGQEAPQILDPGSQIDLTGPDITAGTADVLNFDLAFLVQDPDDVTFTLIPALGGYEPLTLVTD